MDMQTFTMEEADTEIWQIVQQQGNGQTNTAGPQDVKTALQNIAKSRGNGNNAINKA